MTLDKLNANKIVDTIFNIKDRKLLEQILVKHINDGTIAPIIENMVNNINPSKHKYPATPITPPDLVQALFDVSDRVPDYYSEVLNAWLKVLLVRVVYLVLNNKNDQANSYKILKQAIPKSRELYAPFALINSLDRDPNLILDNNHCKHLKKLCVERVSQEKFDDLVKHTYFVDTLACWQRWDDSNKYNDFIAKLKESDDKLLRLMERFFKEDNKDNEDKYENKEIFRYQKFHKLIADMDKTKDKLEDIRKNNSDLYKKYKNCIDKYIANYDTREDMRYHYADMD
ncbi:MAG: hypothetical protein HAW61_04925 [Candidatus Portiera sp.]|nr:hypothetical protein [Portiera sp.]